MKIKGISGTHILLREKYSNENCLAGKLACKNIISLFHNQ